MTVPTSSIASTNIPSASHFANAARSQGLTLVHVTAQLEQLQDTFMS